MSIIHNRTGIALCAASIATELLGAGCQKQSGPSAATAPTNTDAPSNPADATPDSEIRWTEYRSEKLGITIPYPEGWYTRERDQEGVLRVDFHPTPLPSFEVPSDAMAAVTVVAGAFDEEATVQSYGPTAQREQTSLDGQELTKVSYSTEFETPGVQNEYVVYLWRRNEVQYLVEGAKDDPILSHITRALIARPAEGGTP
ncbi:MAG: hypothetical protein Q7R80_04320 [bacterium]|nr:hypothetical protein [bacterium]